MKIGKVLKASSKLLALLASSFLLFGTVACSSDDSDEDSPVSPTSEPGSEETASANQVLYRTSSSGDCVLAADGSITNFDGDGTSNLSASGTYNTSFLRYPLELDRTSTETKALSAKVIYSADSGYVGVGVAGFNGVKVDGFWMLTAAQKCRAMLSNAAGNTSKGNGWTYSSGLTDSKLTVGTTYTIKVKFGESEPATAGGNDCSATADYIKLEVWDEAGTTLLAYKGNKASYYFADTDKLYLVLGAGAGSSTANATFSDIKAYVGTTEYKITSVTDAPASNLLAISTEDFKKEVNVNESVEISYNWNSTDSSVTVPALTAEDNTIISASAANGKITINGLAGGSTILTVTHPGNTALSYKIEVAVIDYTATTYTGLSLYPANEATSAFEDGEFMLGGFDEAPVLVSGGRIKIYDSEGNLVDTIKFADENISIWDGISYNVASQLVRVENKAVYFTPHPGVLEAGKTYFVAIPKGSITGKIGGATFDGLTGDYANTQWKFSTRAAKTASANMTVNNSQSASTQDFRTIQGALKAIGTSAGDYTITVEPGVYRELLYFGGTANVTIKGNSTVSLTDGSNSGEVMVKFANGQSLNGNENGSANRNLFSINGNSDVTLENIDFVNSYSRGTYSGDAQAEVIGHNGKGKIAAYNCAFRSHQDTIRTTGKAWFYKCYVEGDVDFLWMEVSGVVALYEECVIHSVYDEYASSHVTRITAPRMTKAATVGKGLVVFNSTITDTENQTTNLGRTPWTSGYYSQAAFIGNTITTSGTFTADWENTATSETVALDAGKFIGWKQYNNKINGTLVSNATNSTLISDESFIAKEYSGRKTILNRLLTVDDFTFAQDSSVWDISALETEFNAAEDTSKSLLDDESAVVAKSWMVETAADGTFTDGDLNVIVSGTNANNHGAEVKATGTSSVTITIPKGSYILVAGTCKYGNAEKPYTLTCSNADFKYEFIGTHTYTTEDCYNPGSSRTDLYGDIFIVKSDSTMAISLNSDGVKEYLPFIKLVKEPKYFVETADNGTFTDDEMSVVISGGNANNHGVEVKKSGATSVKVTLPAGSYIFVAGTCKYGTADAAETVNNYTLTCANTDFTQEYVGTHAYESEDCYNPGSSRTDLFGDYYYIKSATAMEITVQSNGVKEYLPFIGAIK